MSSALPVHMAVVAGGTILAQIVNIAGFLIATRFLGPADFGLFGIHMALAAPLAILATGRYEAAFIKAGQAAKVANLFVLAVSAALVFTAVAMLVLAGLLRVVGPVPGLSLAVVGALMLGQALVSSTTQLNTYNRSFRLIAVSRVLGAVGAQTGVIALAALAGAGHHALGLGMALGMLVATALSLAGNAAWLKAGLGAVSPVRMYALARGNISYLLFNGPQALASALQESAAVAVITAFFGQAATGLYVFANRLMIAPISIVAESVGRVLQRQFGDMARSDIAERGRVLRAATLSLGLLALAFGAVAWIGGPPAVAALFSAEWLPMGDLVRAGAPYYAAYLVAASLAAIPLATGDHKPMAALGIIGSTLYVVLLAATGTFKTDFAEAFLIVSAGMAVYFSVFVSAIHYVVIGRHAR